MSISESTMIVKTGGIGNSSITQTQPAINILTYQHLEQFKSLRENWTSLLRQSQNQAIFLTWEWLYAWEKHLGKQRELWLVTALINDNLVGIAPLMLKKMKKHGVYIRLLCSLGAPHIDVGGFIVQDNDPQIYAALCNYLISRKKDWDLLEFDEVDVEKGGLDLIKPLFEKSGFSTLQIDNRHSYINASEGWEVYFQSLPKKARHELRRKTGHVEAAARAKFVRHTGREITCDDLTTMFSINKHGHFPGFYQQTEEQEFQHELLRYMPQKGWPDISILYLDDKPAAFCYGFIYNERLELWRTGFDTTFQYLSVGIVLMNWVLEDSFKQNIREVDFLRGKDSYKEQWRPKYRTYAQFRAASNDKLKPLTIAVLLPKLYRYINTQYQEISAAFFRKQK